MPCVRRHIIRRERSVPCLRDHVVPRERGVPCVRQSIASGVRLAFRGRRHRLRGESHAVSVRPSVGPEERRADRGRWTSVLERARLTLEERDLRREIVGRLRIRHPTVPLQEAREEAGGLRDTGVGDRVRVSGARFLSPAHRAGNRHAPARVSTPCA